MEKRRLGSSELYVSTLGLGCMSLGTEENHARNVIETALEEGVNYFDTADLYDFGVNEKIVGQALRAVREEVIIATKVGNRWNEAMDGWRWDASKAYIKEAVKQSLLRLDTDYIDLYQLHGGTLEDPISETIEAFEELVAEGYIRYYGISSIRPNVIRQYVKDSHIQSNMMQYSLLDRRPEEEALQVLASHHVSVVARGPVARGFLTERWLHKDITKGYLDYSGAELSELVQQLQAYFKDRSLTEVALQYVLAMEPVAAVVAGASSPDQVRNNAKAVRSTPLSKPEIDWIRSISKQNTYEQHR